MSRKDVLQALGIDRWVRRDGEHAFNPPSQAPPVVPDLEGPDAEPMVPEPVAALEWPALERRVAECTLCGLHARRTQTVFGVGDRSAQLFVVGEAPGAEEDRQGEPFVGRAGQLLNAMLRAIGLDRRQVFIANVLKCRPPHNRDPQGGEVAACLPYLERQIELVDPAVILCVGRIAAQNLLGTDAPLARLRGEIHRLGPAARPLIVTYHPAYLLRTPTDKARAWLDLVRVRDLLAELPVAPEQ